MRRRQTRNPFESRTEVWRQVGLGGEVDRSLAHRAQGGLIVLFALIVGVPAAGVLAAVRVEPDGDGTGPG